MNRCQQTDKKHTLVPCLSSLLQAVCTCRAFRVSSRLQLDSRTGDALRAVRPMKAASVCVLHAPASCASWRSFMPWACMHGLHIQPGQAFKSLEPLTNYINMLGQMHTPPTLPRNRAAAATDNGPEDLQTAAPSASLCIVSDVPIALDHSIDT